jgi:N utilization substance protein B
MSQDADHRRRGSRYRARKRAVALLFEAELRDADVVELAEERRRMGADSQEFHDVAPYTMEIVTGVAERLDRLDGMISDHLREWRLERLPAVDRAVLRAGAWELLYGGEDLAAATVIDQSVLLTADLSAEKSVAFVNAVLDRIAGLADHIRAAERAVSTLDAGPEADPAGETAADVAETTPDGGGTGPAD